MRYDLHRHLHLDLDDWLRGERHWCTLFELRDLLPGNSCLAAAQAADEQLAEVMQGHPLPAKPPMSFRDFDHDLADLKDLVSKVLWAVSDQDPNKAPASPRPVAAYTAIQRRNRAAGLRSMVARALGRKEE